ncbi:MAG: response regulator [Rhodospirillales bacterium]|nr:response regulator [Rhodospirillales bacterium]
MTADEVLDLSKFTVLIVDDYSFVSQIIAATLKEMGIGRVLISENGAHAKEQIQALNNFENGSNIDVVIMDWLMPVMDGRALLQWIRQSNKDTIKFLPVVVCSAYTSGSLVSETRDLGANEVIVKPVSAAELAKRIQRTINSPRPFVKSKSFFGPDRRRQNRPFDHEDRRKARPQDLKAHYEQK